MNLQIRPAVPADAEAILAYLPLIFDEPDNEVLYEPGEFAFTVEQEREFIARRDGVLLLALVAGVIIGVAGADRGVHRATRHVVGLGLSVHPDWRRRGVGRALLRAVLDWADAQPDVLRVELSVNARNTGALALYEECGFEREGVRRAALRKAGKLLDVVVMGRVVG